MTSKKELFEKTFILKFYLDSIHEQEEFLGKEKLQQLFIFKDSNIFSLIKSLADFLKIDPDFWSEKDPYCDLVKTAKESFNVLRNRCGYEFDKKRPPILKWRNVVQSIRAQFLEKQVNQDLAFYSFLTYQKILIEKFVKENVSSMD